MVFDGLFVVTLKADGFSSQILKISLLIPIIFCLSITCWKRDVPEAALLRDQFVCVLTPFRQNGPGKSASC